MESPHMVIYSRKSRFTGKGESIENQVEMCRQYIRVHFGDEAAREALAYEDEGFSGGTLERPQFKRMMADAARRPFRAIVVYRLDRISRSIGDFAKLIEQLNAMKIDFISIKEQFNTSSPMGRAMMYISSVFSQLERETIAERIRDNMRELSKTGRWLGGVTPTGYVSESETRVSVDGKTRRACRLKAVPEELALVRRIFETFLETGSLVKTEARLLRSGCTTKNGNPFTRFAIRGILTNPVYLVADEAAYRYLAGRHVELCAGADAFDGVHGVMAYNRTLQQPGKAHRIRPMEEWIVSVGGHRGAVDGEAWVKVQEMLERNRAKGYRRPRSEAALLSGTLVCGRCGAYMRPKLTGRVNGAGEAVYAYLCSGKERSRGGLCGVKNCSGNLLDAAVLEELKSLGEDGARFLRQLGRGGGALADGCGEERAGLEAGRAANDGEIRALVSALAQAAGTSARTYILQEIDRLHRKGEEIRRRLDALEEPAGGDPPSGGELDFLARTLSSFRDTVDAMTVEQKRSAVRTLVKKVVWDGERAHVVLVGGADPFASHRAERPLCEDSK